MKISIQLLNIEKRESGYIYSNSILMTDMEMVLILCLLRKYEKINHQSLKTNFKSLREGTFLRRVKTYHSKINDKWYSDEGIVTIFRDVCLDVLPKDASMDLEEFIEYIRIWDNKPRNYCLDIILCEFVAPFIRNKSTKSDTYLKSFGLNCPVADLSRCEPSGYCCSDCDGDYEQYRDNYIDSVANENKRVYKKCFEDYIHQQKTHYSHFVIPKKEIDL